MSTVDALRRLVIWLSGYYALYIIAMHVVLPRHFQVARSPHKPLESRGGRS